MKKLFLVRHAKSDRDNPSYSDFERPLNTKGLECAPLMANYLLNQKIKPDLIITSTAKRAFDTAHIFAKILSISEKNIISEKLMYSANTEVLVKIIQQVSDEHKCIMIFGHNPTITYAAEVLTGEFIEHVPTAGLIEIAVNTEHWKDLEIRKNKLKLFTYPKLLKK